MSKKWYIQVFGESRGSGRVGVTMKSFKDQVGTDCSFTWIPEYGYTVDGIL